MYEFVSTNSFDKDVKKIKKDHSLYSRLVDKIKEILENPEHFPVKKYNLKGKRSAHVGSYVILFEIKGNEVVFHKFRHHDHVYS